MYHPARWVITAVFILIIGLAFPDPVRASGNLEDASDIISSDSISRTDVNHTVSFTLPLNAQGIAATDYIIISLTNFGDVTAPSSLTGTYFGSPVFSVSGTDAKVTGIALNPGYNLSISGITATNPGISSLFGVRIVISEDADGLIVKNIANITASPYLGSVAVTATVIPPVASLTIAGFAAPSTFVTLTENGAVIGTDTAGGSNGTFSKYLTGLDPNITHSITLFGVDQVGRTTSPYSISIYTPIYQNTTVSNLILSPTIALTDTEITQGDPLPMLGSTIPSGTLSIFTESPLRTYLATASSAGNWSYTITNSASYIPGDYRLYSLVNNGSGGQSINSNSLQFRVLALASTSSGADCDLSHGNLNCDAQVNLSDFSILMYYWGTTNAASDINGDNLVNLTDFSIMMYYWGTG